MSNNYQKGCARAAAGGKAAADCHILVVDDDRALRFLARKAFESEGFTVSEAGSGDEALATLAVMSIDCVLLDACMPGLSGFETAERIRTNTRLINVPIVMATGLDDEASIERAFIVGANDYVTKPINWQVLKKRMHSLIKQADVQARSGTANAEIDFILERGANTALILDGEGVIQSIDRYKPLPSSLDELLSLDACLFDCLPAESRPGALDAWRMGRRAESKGTFVMARPQGDRTFAAEVSFFKRESGDTLCLIRDFTDSYIAEQKIYTLANFDKVTGQVTSTLFVEQTAAALERDLVQKCETCICRIAVENYSALYDQLDRQGMQTVAKSIVQRIDMAFAEGCDWGLENQLQHPLIGRLSDHEFVVLLSAVKDPQLIESKVQTLAQGLLEPFTVNGYKVAVRTKVGFSGSAEGGHDAQTLIESARFACLEEPGNERGGLVRSFSPKVRERVAHRTQIEQLLRRDLERDRLHMHYQPKVSAQDLKLVGMEALIRWDNQEHGAISPAQFIPLAERVGLIEPLSEFVIDAVLNQSAEWINAGEVAVPVAINLPGSLLTRHGIVDALLQAISKRGLMPAQLEIEVTEGVMVERGSLAIAHLRQMREMGIRIAIDDFGTGYSSLSYLRDLPVDTLKIDRSFVSNLHQDNTALAIARAIVSVGHDIGLQVVAEGVENALQLARLREIGCDVIQGYYTGRPVSAEGFFDALNSTDVLGSAADIRACG